MMCNICRGKRVENNAWTSGYYVFDECDLIVEDLNTRVRGIAELPNVHPVSRETVGRSTGKNDKNGVMIFEGDIIEHFGCIKYIIRYGEFAGEVGLGYYYGLGFYVERIGNPEHRVPFSSISCDKKEYEVIGNVHDNPELLVVED